MSLPRNALSGYPQTSPPPVPTVTFVGVSGRAYVFHVYPFGHGFKPVPGVYVMCKEETPKVLSPLYFGEGESLHDRVGEGLTGHHKWLAAVLAGATHMCGMIVSGGKAERCAIETDLRQAYNPPLNDQ